MKWMKWHGAGNDFLIGDWSEAYTESEWQSLIVKISHRHFGVGADGVMLVVPDTTEDCAARMLYYNADGSRAAMCGNGIRCFAAHLHYTGRVREGNFKVMTDDGPKAVTLSLDGMDYKVTISMGEAIFETDQIPVLSVNRAMLEEPIQVLDRSFTATALRVGVPHLVIETDVLDEGDIRRYGAALEKHPAFPQKINVNFVRQISDSAIEVVTWERGAGLTMACGTGACAAFYALFHSGKLLRSAIVAVPGGLLEIRADEHEEIFMTGPAVKVAEVETFATP